jgi:membrane peptidoglycan carboxypeptidase
MARKALIHQIEARERRGRWFGALATLLSMSLLLAGWVGLFAFLGTNSAYGTFEGIKKDWVPDTRSMELTLPDLSRVSRIYAESGEVLAELHDGRNSEPVPYEEVPEVLVYAILAAEKAQRERESRLIRCRCVDPNHPPTFGRLSWRWAK